VNRW
jgi:hypothetical protein